VVLCHLFWLQVLGLLTNGLTLLWSFSFILFVLSSYITFDTVHCMHCAIWFFV